MAPEMDNLAQKMKECKLISFVVSLLYIFESY